MTEGPVYRRSRNGIRVHREGCPYWADCVPWDYAAGWPEAKMRNTIVDYPWLRLCRRCWK